MNHLRDPASVGYSLLAGDCGFFWRVERIDRRDVQHVIVQPDRRHCVGDDGWRQIQGRIGLPKN